MTEKIKLDTDQMDRSVKRLLTIQTDLEKQQLRLTADLAKCIKDPKLADDAVTAIHSARKTVNTMSDRCGSQSRTLERRAALARLADGRVMSKDDIAILLSISTGPNPLAAKSKRLSKILAAIAANGGAKKEGHALPNSKIAKWAKYWTKANTAGGKNGGLFTLGRKQVEAFVRGKGSKGWPELAKDINVKAKTPLKGGADARKGNGKTDKPKPITPSTPPPALKNPWPVGHPKHIAHQKWIESMYGVQAPAGAAPPPNAAADEVVE